MNPFSFISSSTGLSKDSTLKGSRCGFIHRLWKPGRGVMLTVMSGFSSKRSISSPAIGLPPMMSMSPASMAPARGSASMIGRMTTRSSFGRSGS